MFYFFTLFFMKNTLLCDGFLMFFQNEYFMTSQF